MAGPAPRGSMVLLRLRELGGAMLAGALSPNGIILAGRIFSGADSSGRFLRRRSRETARGEKADSLVGRSAHWPRGTEKT